MSYCNIFLLLAILGSVISCVGGGSGATANYSGSGLIFDAVATIPVVNNQPTMATIYIHNTSAMAIQDISYTSQSNSPYPLVTPLLTKSTVKNCRNIAANSSCALTIITPSLIGQQDTDGSGVISASYRDSDGKTQITQQIINYAQMGNTNKPLGVSTDARNSIANAAGYVMVFAYNSGLSAAAFSDIHAASVKLINDNNGELPPLSVRSYELQTTTATATLSYALSGGSCENDTQLTANISMAPMADGGYLVTGSAGSINTYLSTNESYVVMNAGNQRLTINSMTTSNQTLTIFHINPPGQLPDCFGGKILQPGEGCTVHYSLPAASANGSAIITIQSSNNAVSNQVNWYNSKNYLLVGIQANTFPLALNPGVTASESITFTNYGGLTINNLNITSSKKGAGVITQTATTCGSSLAPLADCTTSYTISDSIIESNVYAQVNLSAIGSNGNGYSGGITIPYSNKYLVGIKP